MLPLWSVSLAGALIAPALPSRPLSRVRWPGQPSILAQVRKSSDSWDTVQQELYSQLGLGDGEEAIEQKQKQKLTDLALASASPAAAAGSTATPPSAHSSPRTPAPRSGVQPWGSWSQEGDSVNLEIALPRGVTARDVRCELNKDGILRITLKGGGGAEGGGEGGGDAGEVDASSPLLVGRIALPVDRTDLMWGVEEDSDGERLLCVELPLWPADPKRTVMVDCIFDESLEVQGRNHGLVAGLNGVGGVSQ